jgi:hypothetical protein
MKSGALFAKWDQVSKTVQKVIIFVEKLGETYLWVDTLYIIQGDVQGMENQLASMSLIYSSAVVTVATAFGRDASAGLPGARP